MADREEHNIGIAVARRSNRREGKNSIVHCIIRIKLWWWLRVASKHCRSDENTTTFCYCSPLMIRTYEILDYITFNSCHIIIGASYGREINSEQAETETVHKTDMAKTFSWRQPDIRRTWHNTRREKLWNSAPTKMIGQQYNLTAQSLTLLFVAPFQTKILAPCYEYLCLPP